MYQGLIQSLTYTMKFSLLILTLLVFVLFPNKGKATHIVGGELYYESLGNDQYRIILKIYRDCINGQVGFDDPASVGVFDVNNILVQEILMDNPVITQLPVVVDNPCLQVPPVICTEEGIYTKIVTLTPSAGGFNLVYQRCCRNNIIENIMNPESSGSTYMSHIPDATMAMENNSSHFKNLPPLVLCNGEDFVFDHSALDPDGDDLVYEFCDPYLGASDIDPMPQPPNNPPYNNISWSGGYDINNQILGSPNLQIDATTGELTCTPNTNGIYVVGICVKEYRNGELINTTLRDFQFTVVTCSQNVISAVPDQSVLCDGYTLNFINNSVNSSFYHWDFGVPDIDYDTSDLANPTFVYPDTGIYEVTLIANPGWPCADTSIASYFVQYPINASIDPVFDQCFENNSYDFNINGNFTTEASVAWSFSNSIPLGSSSFSPSGIQFQSPGIQSIVATVNDRNCSRDFVTQVSILENPTAITIGDTICNNLTFSPNNSSIGGNGYYWDFGDSNGASDNSTLQNPTYTYSQPGVYSVTLVVDNNNTCFDTVVAEYDIRAPINTSYATFSPQCIDINSFDFVTSGNYTNAATFLWDFGNNATPSNSILENPTQIVYDTTGSFPISLIIDEDGCTDTFVDTVLVYPTPIFTPTVVGDTGCAPYTLSFIDNSFFEGNANYFWEFGDGNTSTEASPSNVYSDPGTYSVIFNISTLEGCLRDFQQTFTDAVVVFPSPTARFDVTEPNLLQSIIVTDQSSVDVTSFHFNIEGNIIDSSFFEYSFEGDGMQEITQIVYNDFNCTDTAIITLEIAPEVFLFIPNSFTPDNDGLNDDFKPVSYGTQSYQFKVFNRWGELIYYGNESSPAWDGSINGIPVQSDIYVWRIDFKDYKGLDHHKFGHVSVLR